MGSAPRCVRRRAGAAVDGRARAAGGIPRQRGAQLRRRLPASVRLALEATSDDVAEPAEVGSGDDA